MPQREPALRWLRDCALTALVLALCTLTSWVFFRLDFVSSNYILTYILGVMYINVFSCDQSFVRRCGFAVLGDAGQLYVY